MDLVASGATNTQVATALGISPATVRKHLEHAYAKLDVSTRTAAARVVSGSAQGVEALGEGGPGGPPEVDAGAHR